MFGYFQHDVCKELERQDFFRFSREFTRVIYDNIPTVKELEFLDPPEVQPAITPEEDKEAAALRQAMEKAVEQGIPVIHGNILLLPFVISDGSVVAKVTGLDDYFLRTAGNDWLNGLGFLLTREFLLVKCSCIDSLTGLLSSLHLEDSLNSIGAQGQGVMILVSVYPKGSSSFQAKKYQHQTISLLKAFVEDRFPLYYLGQSCFGMLCRECDADFGTEFAPALVNYLKREHCVRVHIAVVHIAHTPDESETESPTSETIMKKAWAALHVASKRGPFAFCNYNSIEKSASHPLVAPKQPLTRWIQNATRGLNAFSLLQFDSGEASLLESAQAIIGEDMVCYQDTDALFLLISAKNAPKSLEIAKKIIQHLGGKDESGLLINCGVSLFPMENFRKSEMLLNCRKALCHADFLTPGSLVVCDALSFNISGDIYYGDGDLILAVKEYKRGLALDGDNGNLLNSLGVCYAQMNKHKLAVDCFQKASQSGDDQFMALYNLGLEQQIKNENKEAIHSFNSALLLPEEESEEKARMDMSFQLAVLCIREGRFEQALELLLPWFTVLQKKGGGDKGLRHLGEASYGLGKARDAMKYLQQALRYDEYDAEVLGLLGEIYLQENEGDDIALRFCEKATELSPDSLNLKGRLASAQIQCGDYKSALKNLQPCLRNKRTRPAALIQRGLLARESGQLKQAEKWFVKGISCPDGTPETGAAARKYLNDLKGKQ